MSILNWVVLNPSALETVLHMCPTNIMVSQVPCVWQWLVVVTQMPCSSIFYSALRVRAPISHGVETEAQRGQVMPVRSVTEQPSHCDPSPSLPGTILFSAAVSLLYSGLTCRSLPLPPATCAVLVSQIQP